MNGETLREPITDSDNLSKTLADSVKQMDDIIKRLPSMSKQEVRELHEKQALRWAMKVTPIDRNMPLLEVIIQYALRDVTTAAGAIPFRFWCGLCDQIDSLFNMEDVS